MKANDFRDERNALLDRLSELLPITSYENTYGETVVHLYGRDLVNSNEISTVDIKKGPTGLADVYFKNSNDKMELNGLGELGGYIDARDKSMVQYMDRLDILVSDMAEKINELHKSGTSLLGKDIGNPNGLPFFVGAILDGEEVITAANIKVNPELANFNKIAVSKSGEIGDGDIAKEIYEIRNKTLYGKYDNPDKKDMNIDDYYRDIVLSLGLEREASRTISNNQDFLIKSIDDKRKSISQVSLDEEMVDMIKFQHSYVANSRVINAIDEMIENVVNRVGLVGR